MTRAGATLLFGLATVFVGCSTRAKDAPVARGGTPGWVPPYNAAQVALLEPGNEPVRTRAERVFPDLDTFVYSDDLELGDPHEAVRVTQLVAEAFQHTPRSYELADAGPDLANAVVQYGPRGDIEPDTYKIAYIDAGGARAHLVQAVLSSDAMSAMDDGEHSLSAKRFGEAEARFTKAVSLAPALPATHLALAEALAARSPDAAEAELRSTIRLEPTLAVTHRALAKLLLARGDISGARIETAHALAYWPTSERTMEVARALPREGKEGDAMHLRIAPYPIFLDVDAAGAIHVASSTSPGARMYGGCRALLRYEPEMRAELFGTPRDAPYFLSAEEEMICTEAGIGALIVDRETASTEGHAPAMDAQGEALLRMAHTEGLLGFVMFEIIGQARPDIARMAPAHVHRAMVTYIERHVLGIDDPSHASDDVASN